jgi:PII-like signaling protein
MACVAHAGAHRAIVVVDKPERIERLIPEVEAMTDSGIIVVSEVTAAAL